MSNICGDEVWAITTIHANALIPGLLSASRNLSLRRKGVTCVPDQLVCSCDGPPEQIVILHGEVCDPAIELSNIEDSEEVCSVKERGVGRQAG